jgi:hypothetical protein
MGESLRAIAAHLDRCDMTLATALTHMDRTHALDHHECALMSLARERIATSRALLRRTDGSADGAYAVSPGDKGCT